MIRSVLIHTIEALDRRIVEAGRQGEAVTASDILRAFQLLPQAAEALREAEVQALADATCAFVDSRSRYFENGEWVDVYPTLGDWIERRNGAIK